MDPLPPPLALLVLLFSGGINRQQQAVIDTCARKTGFSARRMVANGFASPTISDAAWP
jgi:hypothetical protein